MEKQDDPQKNLGDKAKESLEKFTNKISEKFDSFRNHERFEDLRNFTTEHKRDTIVYIVLLIGLVLSFFRPFLGDALIGIVVGLYFAEELVEGSRKLNDFIERQGLFRMVIFCFLGIALFIAAPGIFLGAAVAFALKMLIAPSAKP